MTKLIQIGNSKGIRIPKNLIKKAHLEGNLIDLEIKEDGLLLKPIKKNSREGWEEQIKKELDRNNEKDRDDILDFDLDIKDWQW